MYVVVLLKMSIFYVKRGRILAILEVEDKIPYILTLPELKLVAFLNKVNDFCAFQNSKLLQTFLQCHEKH